MQQGLKGIIIIIVTVIDTWISIFVGDGFGTYSSRGILTLVLSMVGHLGQHFMIIFITLNDKKYDTC